MKNAITRGISLLIAIAIIFIPIQIPSKITVNAAEGRLYNQNEPKWKNVKFTKYAASENDMYTSGCGIFSFCNAIYALNGNKPDAVEVATWAVNNGSYQPGNGGMYRQPFYNQVQSAYGDKFNFKIDGQYYGKVTDARLINHLKNGGVAAIHVYGHFMAITGYNASNNTYHVIESAVYSGRGLQADSWVSASKMSSGNTNVDWYALISMKNVEANEFFDFWGVDDGISISGTYKIWLKQTGLGDASNSDVNLFIDGKEASNCVGTIYQDESGFYSFEIDTTKYPSGEHTIYAVFRNASGIEKWVCRNLIFEQNKFFDFWGIDEGIIISDEYKVWLKQVGLGDSSNSDVNLYIDGKEIENHLSTLYQDDKGYYSYELDTTKFSNGQHTIFAVLRNTSGVEIWVSRTLVFQKNNENESLNIIGDVNADNYLNISDVVLLQKWLLAVPDTELPNWKAADLCEDGKLDAFDMIEMRKLLIQNNSLSAQ